MTIRLGRRLFGVASILLGIADLALHDQLTSNWTLPGDWFFIMVASIAQITGGIAIQLPKTERPGAIILGGVYAVFACTFVPEVVGRPGAYYTWGDVFYRLASVSGAVLAYYAVAPSAPHARAICKAALIVFGACNVSFAVEQLEYLARTASLVPKWVPPNGMFWTVATTVAFALGGISVAIGYKSLTAARLLALMLALFGIAIWIPLLIVDPKTHSNWSEGLETFLIAGDAWIVADFLICQRVISR